MRIKDPLSEGEEPFNLVPLTDMVFNLLIFFMCATTFAQVEKDLAVQLPKTSSSFAPMSAPPKDLIINIKQDGTTVVGGKTYDNAKLGELIAGAAKRSQDQSVIIRADERSVMRYFAAVTQLCKKAGIKQAKIMYLDEAGKPAPGN
ncbi:MAG: Biopolymer transport protein ExbD/TolR [Phycisphaerales bacterium]|jgi:biopolymer transport protein ExbD|nr:Biopolymer transport protein ExbD/TolR [Phycisphaerales bacterium]